MHDESLCTPVVVKDTLQNAGLKVCFVVQPAGEVNKECVKERLLSTFPLRVVNNAQLDSMFLFDMRSSELCFACRVCSLTYRIRGSDSRHGLNSYWGMCLLVPDLSAVNKSHIFAVAHMNVQDRST